MATIVNIADPTTPSNVVAVNSLGQIAISNFPSVQSVVGTVSIAQFPSVQAVSGSVDIIDRASRSLGHVIVDSGGSGTNTAPGYSIIQDPNSNSRKLAINSDGSINITITGNQSALASNITQFGGVSLTNTNPIPNQDIEQANYISATTPPSVTNIGTDTLYTFSSQVSRVILQNNTSVNVNYAFDVTSSAGSLLLLPGSTLVYPKKCTVLHLFTAAAQNINGSSTGNIVVLGAN